MTTQTRMPFDRLATITLTIPGIPPSAKNRRRLVRRPDGRIVPIKSDEARAFESRLRRALGVALAQRGLMGRGTHFGDRDVELELVVDEAQKRTRITVRDLGPKPTKGPTNRRRDVQNCLEVPCDALQGLLYDDDRQLRRVEARFGEIDGLRA